MEHVKKHYQEASDDIRSIIQNFKKDPAKRKNQAYYVERLRRLEAAWEKFQLHAEQHRSSNSFSEDDYDETKDLFREYQRIFNVGAKQEDSLSLPSGGGIAGEVAETPLSSAADHSARQRRRQNALAISLNRLLDGIEDDQTESYYTVKIASVNSMWAQLEQLYLTMAEECESGNNPLHDQYFQLHDRVQGAVISMTTYLSQPTSIRNQLSTPNSELHLPRITIPRFDGDYLEWNQFKDLFTQMISNQNIPDVQKFMYLKASIGGEAERLIRHLPPTTENFTTAWKLLLDRYTNKRVVTAAILGRLLGQPSHAADHASSASALKALHDTTVECLEALKNLAIPTTNWDPLLLVLLSKKIDKSTHVLYEQSLKAPKEIQSLDEFLQFLQFRFQSLEVLGQKDRSNPRAVSATVSRTQEENLCRLCNQDHQLFKCAKFINQTIAERMQTIKRLRSCINCLKPGHIAATCASRSCLKCNKKHNTLLHKPEDKACKPQEPLSSALTSAERNPSNVAGNVLLSTAIVNVTGHNGVSQDVRALLDSGSQINIITKQAVKRLKLTPRKTSIEIEGVGQGRQQGHAQILITLQSKTSTFKIEVEAVVLDKILSEQPKTFIDTSNWKVPKNIVLADPRFNQPGAVDLLLGAEFYHDLLSIGQIKLIKGLPTLQNTVLGWVVAGRMNNATNNAAWCNVASATTTVEDQIERFWKIEEINGVEGKYLAPAEKRCELHFTQTFQRLTDGRFMVKLPFQGNPASLGNSKEMAYRRFLSVERRLLKQPELKSQYIAFMREYLELKHMTEIDEESIINPNYFLPHHCVVKPDSSTTKLRVVFDGSAATTSGQSLNSILYNGPTVQDDLFSILLRFRLPKYVFTADIEKMYRQILVNPDDCNFQLIYWRETPTDPIKCYQLKTVTYGTRCASFLATRTLQEVAKIGQKDFPQGSAVLGRDFYVDDVMTGANSLQEITQMKAQLRTLLTRAGFHLRKWCANHTEVLTNIKADDQAFRMDITDEKDAIVKTLGITWMPKGDQFHIRASWEDAKRITKRIVTSQIARLFDPLGIMAPVVVTAKIFLQELWLLKTDWDAALPMALHTKWLTYFKQLQEVKSIKFPRHVFANDVPKSIQLHTFCDASEKAYGAALYVRSVVSQGRVIVRLLCAKSRVAPLKRLTIPRLELCAAKLAADLTARVKRDLNWEDKRTTLWTDSEIVLAWINSESSDFQTFVANRISSIQETSIQNQWRHVTSKLNPADLVSRGVAPESLKNQNLWFYGPLFLHGDESCWPPAFNTQLQITSDVERRVTAAKAPKFSIATDSQSHVTTMITSAGQESSSVLDKIDHRNSFTRLQKIVSYILRFKSLTQCSSRTTADSKLSVIELEKGLKIIVKTMQYSAFKPEITQLQNKQGVQGSNQLSPLAPFIDEDGIVRVGGRLQNSSLSYDAKHPMLLPYHHLWTKLLINDIHQKNMHCGPQTLLAITRQRFWPLKGKTISRSIVQHCVRCTRANPKLLTQFMGALPSHRSQPARPFINVGVDFCGPVYIHYKSRGKHPQKAYIAVFCCFATKAVHMEMVANLTTEAFIGALRRFTGRRGHCKTIYCDNATNFVGTSNLLSELRGSIQSKEAQEKIAKLTADNGIEFRFIPPRAPHFGGLWEAAVKSAKTLLKRGLASSELTYEELETIIIDVEAILNSRPLTPLSDNPNDLTALTPGHFLIGEPMTANVDHLARDSNSSLLKRWHNIRHINQEFWRRWSTEYLNQLQCRYKWKQKCHNLTQGSLVLIKEDNIPVMKWPLGRVVNIHRGDDGLIRVVDIKTQNGVLRRAIHRLAPLPVDNDINTNNNECDEAPPGLDPQQNAHSNSRSEQKPHPRKKLKLSPVAVLLSTLMVSLLLPNAITSPVEITHFNPEVGMHFDYMGKIKIVSSEWNVIAFYDLQPFWTRVELLKTGTEMLENLCQQMQNSSCNSTLFQLTELKGVVTNNTNNLFRGTKRHKRGAINVIGNIANALFGVLDSEYAERMAATIDNIKSNEGHLLNLVKNQTSMIDSTINIMKKDQIATADQFQSLQEQISAIRNNTNNYHAVIYQLQLSQMFSDLALNIFMVAHQLEDTQTAIIDVLTNAHQGHISSLLMSFNQLKKQVTTIHNNLPQFLRLPMKQDDLLHLYKVMHVSGRTTDKYVLFKITIPLVTLETFVLYKTIPIPKPINNTFVTLQTCSSHIAMTLHREQFFPISEHQLAACLRADEDEYLCQQSQPVLRRLATTCKCESDLLNGAATSTSCDVSSAEAKSGLVMMNKANKWIFMFMEDTTLNIICLNESIQARIHGAGILQMQPDCTIKHNEFTLQGHQIFSIPANLSLTKFERLEKVVPPRLIDSLGIPKHHNLYAPQLSKINELHQDVLRQHLEFKKSVQPRTTHGITVAYMALALGVLVAGWKVLKRLRRPINQQQQINQRAEINSRVSAVVEQSPTGGECAIHCSVCDRRNSMA